MAFLFPKGNLFRSLARHGGLEADNANIWSVGQFTPWVISRGKKQQADMAENERNKFLAGFCRIMKNDTLSQLA